MSEPVAPRALEPPRFPTMSVVAPLVLAAVLVAVFRTPYALMIGVLGPVMGLASWWESRKSARDRHRGEVEEYEQACVVWRREREREDSAYRDRAYGRTPSVAQWMENPLWRPPLTGAFRIGTHLETRDEAGQSRTIPGMPCTVPVGEDIAVVGVRSDIAGIVRHIRTQQAASGVLRSCDVVVCATAAEVPVSTRVVLQCSANDTTLCIDGIRVDRGLWPDVLSEAEHRWALRRLETYETGALDPVVDPADRSALWCDLGGGPWDVVNSGPHALVWGRTGRGKTVLLRRLICDLAGRYRPDQVSIAVMDFKGGSALVGLRSLPHLVGELSDLEPDRLDTAFRGVQAEMRTRESLLAEAGCASLAELPASVTCPRIVLIVDEIAWLMENHPSASAVLADVAARGRSLGLHVILCGQRLGSTIPRSVLANAGVRVCLGVTDGVEAEEYLPGVPPDQISRLATKPPGAFVMATIGSGWQEGTVEPLACPVSDGAPVGPLWAPDLPELVEPEHGLIALREAPEQQHTVPVSIGEINTGVCCVVGDRGAGVSGALQRVGEAVAETGGHVFVVPDEACHIVDALQAACLDTEPVTRIIPSLTSLERVAGADAKAMVADMVARAHSQGSEHGSRLVLGLRPDSVLGASIRRAQPHLWLLRIAVSRTRESWLDHRNTPVAAAIPGRGVRDGDRIQIACPLDTSLPPHSLRVLPADESRPWMPGETGALEGLGDRDRIESCLSGRGVVLTGLTPAAMRRLLGPEQAPPLEAGEGRGWWCRRGSYRLVQLPSTTDGSTASMPSDVPTD